MYEHQQYLRPVNLTRFTVRLKREEELKSTLSGKLFQLLITRSVKKFARTQVALQRLYNLSISFSSTSIYTDRVDHNTLSRKHLQRNVKLMFC